VQQAVPRVDAAPAPAPRPPLPQVGRDTIMRAVASAVLQADAMEQALIQALPLGPQTPAGGISLPEFFKVRPGAGAGGSWHPGPAAWAPRPVPLGLHYRSSSSGCWLLQALQMLAWARPPPPPTHTHPTCPPVPPPPLRRAS
jgi:hypothetical protein